MLCSTGVLMWFLISGADTMEACCTRIAWIGEQREQFPYDIDGAVVKIDSLEQRIQLGFYSKSAPLGGCL